jgi:hypothetical protein
MGVGFVAISVGIGLILAARVLDRHRKQETPADPTA